MSSKYRRATFARTAPVPRWLQALRHGPVISRPLRPDSAVRLILLSLLRAGAAVALATVGSAAVVSLASLGGLYVLALAFALVCLIAVARLWRRGEWVLGTDGVVLSTLGRQRFIPWEEIRDIGVGGMWLASGEHIPLGLVGGRSKEKELAVAIEERKAGGGGQDVGAVATLMAGGDATGTARVAELRAIAQPKDSGFRTNPLRTDSLWTVLEDTTAPPYARAAAAIALQPSLDKRERIRLRVAAESTASPKLRVALEATARDEDDEAIGNALDALHEGKRR